MWGIAALMVLWVAWSLLAYYLILTGKMQVSAQRREYLSSLGLLDQLASMAVAGAKIFAVVLLWRLRLPAVRWLALALCGSVAVIVYHSLTHKFMPTMGGLHGIGTLLGWTAMLGTILYARRLRVRGILA